MLYLLIWTGIVGIGLAALVNVINRRSLWTKDVPLRISLPRTPNHPTRVEIASLAIRAALKHVLVPIGLSPAFQIDRRSTQQFKLPYIYIQGLLHFDEKDEKLYDEAVNVHSNDERVSPFFLIAQTLPLVIHLLADSACPILPLGAVNTRNMFKIHQPSLARDIRALRKASNESRLSYRAKFGGNDRPGYRRKRGMEFCIDIVIFCDDTAVLTQELWFLQFLPARMEPRFIPAKRADDDYQTMSRDVSKDDASDLIKIGTRDPAKWAAASKDYNPIHISTIGAKLFGFKSVIAHGNHAVAKAVEQLRMHSIMDESVPHSNARRLCWEGDRGFALEIRFVRPMTLPTEAPVFWSKVTNNDSKLQFSISSTDKVCIVGSVISSDD